MAAGKEQLGALLLAAATAVAMAADSGTTGIRASDIDALDALCREPIDPPRSVGAACSDGLDRRFASAPLRDGTALLRAVVRNTGMRDAALNDRLDHLPHAPADRVLADAATWGDVFDDGIDDRIQVVYRVFQDPACAALNGGGGIRVELNERCEARQLFRYAAYLDACTTGRRIIEVHSPRIRAGASLYESLRKSLRGDAEETKVGWRLVDDALGLWRRLRGAGEATTSMRRNVADGPDGRRLAETSLLATWLVEKCSTFRFMPFDRDLRTSGPDAPPDEPGGPGEMLDVLRPGHDAALSIAARAGDPRAVRAFHAEGLAADIEYWKSLRGFDPPLFHRWMAADMGAALGLGPEDRALHALMAFALERRSWPDLELERHLALYGLSREFIDPVWRYGSAPPDAAAIEERLAYPWDAAR